MATFDRQAALNAGFTPQEIDQYLQAHGNQPPIQQPTQAPVNANQMIMGQPSQVRQETPQSPQMPQQPQEVSNTPSTIGTAVGGIVGTPLGPLGRMAGAGIGAGIGQEVAQAQAGQPGDPGAFLPALGPVGMMTRLAQTSGKPKSNTQKAMETGVASQATGEVLAGMFQLFRPKVLQRVVDDLTNIISKNSEGKPVPATDIYTALRQKLQEVAASFSDQGGAITAGTRPLARTIQQIPEDTAVGPEILNILRKRLGMDIGRYSDLSNQEKLFAKAFYSVVKDAQTQAAPATKASIGLQKVLMEHAPNIMDALTLGGFSKISPLIGGAINGLGNVGSTLSKYLFPSVMKSATDTNQ